MQSTRRRCYAPSSAPGQRVAGKGFAFLVERVEVRDELLIYRGEGRELEEGQLDDEQSVSQADDRLIGGRTDSVAQFELRLEGMQRQGAGSPFAVLGFAGRADRTGAAPVARRRHCLSSAPAAGVAGR